MSGRNSGTHVLVGVARPSPSIVVVYRKIVLCSYILVPMSVCVRCNSVVTASYQRSPAYSVVAASQS